ncbi:N/A [soil metagenome]
MKLLQIDSQKNIINRKRQAGMTLTEALLVLSVGALVAVLAYGGYKVATNDVKVQSQVEGTIQLVGKIKQIYSTAANYGAVSAQSLNDARVIPSNFKVSGTGATTAIANAWGGAITPAPGAVNTSFTLTIASIPQEGCIEFLNGISSAAVSLSMGGATNIVKPAGGAFDNAAAATRCAAVVPATAATSEAILTGQ